MLHDLRYTVRALTKWPSFVTGTVLVLGLACYLPARRAARVDPLIVLRKT